MRGGHHLKSWSVTQKSVTLSSAEAELTACIKASVETIGMLQLILSFGVKLQGEVYGDSSAALAVVGRKGIGKLRHIRVGHLWVQQVAEDEVLAYRKIQGTDNPADVNTKNVNQKAIDKALTQVEMKIMGGRAEAGLTVSWLGVSGSGAVGCGGTLGAAMTNQTTGRRDAQWVVYNGRWSDEAEEENCDSEYAGRDDDCGGTVGAAAVIITIGD